MLNNQETNNSVASATTNRPLRVSLHVLVAFAICRLPSVVIVTPTPIALCNHGVQSVRSHVNHKPVCCSAKGATPYTARPVVKWLKHCDSCRLIALQD